MVQDPHGGTLLASLNEPDVSDVQDFWLTTWQHGTKP
jgi:hypothetical protein